MKQLSSVVRLEGKSKKDFYADLTELTGNSSLPPRLMPVKKNRLDQVGQEARSNEQDTKWSYSR